MNMTISQNGSYENSELEENLKEISEYYKQSNENLVKFYTKKHKTQKKAQ